MLYRSSVPADCAPARGLSRKAEVQHCDSGTEKFRAPDALRGLPRNR